MKNISTYTAEIEAIIKSHGFKRVSGLYYIEINAETMAHVVLIDKANAVRAQFGVTNKTLNRVSWNVFSVPASFGTIAHHLTNSTKCTIHAAHVAKEYAISEFSPESAANDISNIAISLGKQFSSIEAIQSQIRLPEREQYDDICLICIAIQKGAYDEARHYINLRREQNFPGFKLSFYTKAERLLKSKTQQL